MKGVTNVEDIKKIKSGTGVNKNISSVGDYFIIGCVGLSYDYARIAFDKQNISYSLIYGMGKVITDGIKKAEYQIGGQNENS